MEKLYRTPAKYILEQEIGDQSVSRSGLDG